MSEFMEPRGFIAVISNEDGRQRRICRTTLLTSHSSPDRIRRTPPVNLRHFEPVNPFLDSRWASKFLYRLEILKERLTCQRMFVCSDVAECPERLNRVRVPLGRIHTVVAGVEKSFPDKYEQEFAFRGLQASAHY